MSIISNVVSILLAGRGVADATPMFQRLMKGIATVVALSVISSILGGVLLVGMIYAAFMALVEHGLEPGAAMLVLGAIILLATVLMVRQIMVSIDKIKHIPQQVMVKQNPLARKAAKVGTAFIDGFLSPAPAVSVKTEKTAAPVSVNTASEPRRAANVA